MCGIAGFSLATGSKINSRQLANAMLTAIEDRGNMASGYAFWHDDNFGYHSEAKPGSSLSLKFMPRKAQTVILHTRLATHGSTSDNRNNHPVTSPSGKIALVHNGVIYNHHEVRAMVSGNLPPVDTSVIPAVIEQHGTKSLNVLDGDAAIAWLDADQPGLLHLARYQHSPLVIALVEDGSFVFASTESLLWRVLIQLDIVPTWMHTPSELEYYQVRNGMVSSFENLPAPKYSGSAYDYGYYRHQTSGAKGIATPPSYSSYEYWDDETDEEWDMYNPPRACSTPSVSLTQKYWTRVQEDLAQHADTYYYDETEHELWVNELYMMANEPSLTLIDYGQIDTKGELISAQDDALF
jgi:asparagine synthetase B (glutamine-hydrolysing)